VLFSVGAGGTLQSQPEKPFRHVQHCCTGDGVGGGGAGDGGGAGVGGGIGGAGGDGGGGGGLFRVMVPMPREELVAVPMPPMSFLFRKLAVKMVALLVMMLVIWLANSAARVLYVGSTNVSCQAPSVRAWLQPTYTDTVHRLLQ